MAPSRLQSLQLSFPRSRRFLVIEFSPPFVRIGYFDTSIASVKLLAYHIQRTASAPNFTEQAESAIKDFISRNKVRVSETELSLSGEGVFIKYLVLPPIPDSEIREAAKWQLKEEVPFDVEAASVDWQVVYERVDEQGITQRGLIFCFADSALLEKYLGILSRCRLKVTRVTTPEFDHENLLRDQAGRLETVAVLDVGFKQSSFCVYHQNKLAFVRRLPLSWERMTLSMTEPVMSERGRTQISFEEAERVKRIIGIPWTQEEGDAVDAQTSYILSLVRPHLEVLTRESRFSISYFNSSFLGGKVGAVYLAGGGADFKNLDRYLERELNMPVQMLKPPRHFVTDKRVGQDLRDQQSQLLHMAGAAVHGIPKIDLLPFELKNRRWEQFKWGALRIATVMGATIFAFFFFVAAFRNADHTRQIENARIHLQATEAIQRLSREIRLREDLWRKVIRGKVPGEGVLKVVSGALPAGMALDEIVFDQAAREVKLSGTQLPGAGDNGDRLINFVQKLEDSDFFISATLVSTQRAADLEQFVISCRLAEGI